MIIIRRQDGTVHSERQASVWQSSIGAKATLEILSDAMRMEREAFRERLEKFLRENGFEI